MTVKRIISFTLVELLIVISIIAVLASMLMPALKKARDSAKKISCANNLKTLSANTMMYVGDYNGYLPPAVNWDGQFWNYGGHPSQNKSAGALADYYKAPAYYFAGGESGLLTCPMDERKEEAFQHYYKPTSYALNASICGYPGLAYTDYGPHKITRYSKPKVLAMEFTGDDNDPATLSRPRFYHSHYNNQQAWHSRGSNFLWIDGHVGWSKYCGLDQSFFEK